MEVIPAAAPGSPHWVYHVATAYAYSPGLSQASHHTHSTFKLAVGDKKSSDIIISLRHQSQEEWRDMEAVLVPPRKRDGGTPGEVPVTHPTWFLPDRIVIYDTKGPKNAVFLHGTWPLPCTSYRGLPSVCVRLNTINGLFTASIHLNTLMQDKERGWLGDFFWLQTNNHLHKLNTQFPSCLSIHCQPVVKQVFRPENFGLMLDFKSFQTKWVAEFSWYMKDRTPLYQEDDSSSLLFSKGLHSWRDPLACVWRMSQSDIARICLCQQD